MAKTIEPNPRSHAAAHLGFGLTVAVSNAWREVGIAEPDIHRAPFYRCDGFPPCRRAPCRNFFSARGARPPRALRASRDGLWPCRGAPCRSLIGGCRCLLRQRSQDLDLILRRDGDELRHVGRSWRRVTHVQHKLLETARCAEEQHPRRRVAEHLESVSDIARPEHVGATSRDRPFTVAHER